MIFFNSRSYAEKWIQDNDQIKGLEVIEWKEYKPYSTSISSAWQVVEKFIKEGYDFDIGKADHIEGGLWDVFIGTYNECAATAPHAICITALMVMGVECF